MILPLALRVPGALSLSTGKAVAIPTMAEGSLLHAMCCCAGMSTAMWYHHCFPLGSPHPAIGQQWLFWHLDPH